MASQSYGPRHYAASSAGSVAFHAPSPVRPGAHQPVFKPMYDLPPTVQSNLASSTSSSNAAGGRPMASHQRLGLASPPPTRPTFGTGTPPPLSSAVGRDSLDRSSYPRPPFVSPGACGRSTPPPPLLPMQSPTPGSVSIYSKAPQNASSPAPADIERFAEHCRALYYEQDPRSARYIERTVQEIPPSHRAAFTRVQAAVRAQYHADEETRRRNEFEVLLRGTDPGGALQIQNRRDPRGASAKKERHDRLKGFLETHAGKNNVGPAPFFVALYTALRLQTVPEAQGGAGQSRVEWEVDDAVWMEAGGKDFMVEAIAIVKGVLGFEDIPRKVKPRRRSRPAPLMPPQAHPFAARGASRSFSSPRTTAGAPFGRSADLEELHSTPEEGSPAMPNDPLSPLRDAPSGGGGRRGKAPPPPTVASNFHTSRRRASSDPFSDPNAQQQQKGGAARQPPPPIPPPHGSVGRRGPAPPPPIRPHPSLTLQPTNSLSSRSTSHTSADSREPTTPGAEDSLLLPARGRPSISSFNGGGGGPGRLGSFGSPSISEHALLDDDIDYGDEACSSALSSTGEDDDFDRLLPRWRTWISPSLLTDPELGRLCALFPEHITKATSKNTRFPYIGPPGTASAIEEGRGEGGKRLGKGILEGAGTGRMWRGERLRDNGYRGGWMERMKAWFSHLFGRT